MPKGKIWFLNHYASRMYYEDGGRHLDFARQLQSLGYEPHIFAANTVHNSSLVYPMAGQPYATAISNSGVPFTFIPCLPYHNNGLKRALNMLEFSLRLRCLVQKLAQTYGRPEVIVASSVHPLTLVAGLKMAAVLDCPVVVEVRDLWPESLISLGKLKSNSLPAHLLYALERWCYQKADALIFTMEGAKQYIQERGWTAEVGLDKIWHINNGVDLSLFAERLRSCPYADTDLADKSYLNFVYTGSLREVNAPDLLVEAMALLPAETRLRLLLWGEAGSAAALAKLEAQVTSLGLQGRVIFKGQVPKQQIPSLLSQSYVNVLHNTSLSVHRYGLSQNKLFEYLAAGKPVAVTAPYGYDMLSAAGCGFSSANTPAAIAELWQRFALLGRDDYNCMCQNSLKLAQTYDFPALTNKLLEVLESSKQGFARRSKA